MLRRTAGLAVLAAAIGVAAPAHADEGSLYRGPAPRPGPDILYAAPVVAPQLTNAGVWRADPILVSGAMTGEAAAMSDLEAVKKALPATPVLANTGVKHETVADVLKVADGCIVGSSLKVDGNTWNAVDPERAEEFMRLVKGARKG